MEDQRKTVGILGGTFDPPTISHVSIIKEALLQKAVDEVWVIPCGYRLDKVTTLTSPEHRLRMTSLAVQSVISESNPELLDRIKINDIEVRNGPSITSYELVQRLEAENPQLSLWFIIGNDLVESLHKWRNADKLINEVKFLVMTPAGVSIDLCQDTSTFKLPKRFKQFTIPENVRSTEYRETIMKNRDQPRLGLDQNLLANEVVDYIQINNLYQPPEEAINQSI